MASGRKFIPGTRQQANGHVGEDRTSGLLGTYFWLLKRNVDFDGADFLLQTVSESIEEERRRSSGITATGVVQAKFFEAGNTVKIRRDYAEEAGKPREEFFLLAHTNGEQGKQHHYFLDSHDIAKLPASEDESFRIFRVTKSESYESFRDIAPDMIADSIRAHLERVERRMSQVFLRRAFFHYRTSHMISDTKRIAGVI